MVVLIEQTKQNSARAVFHYDSMHKVQWKLQKYLQISQFNN